jgi:hypothetical protein
MANQIKLNFKMSRWILILSTFTVAVNIISMVLHELSIVWFVNILNVVTIVNTLIVLQESHRKYEVNKSYRLYYTMPLKKLDILKADYATNTIMMIVSFCIFITWAIATDYLVLSYGMIMIIGISLIMNSIYHIIFVNDWFNNISIKEFCLSIIPLLIVLMLHFMPFKNIYDRNLNLPEVITFYFTRLPFIVLGVGLVIYIVSYYVAKRKIIQTDIE